MPESAIVPAHASSSDQSHFTPYRAAAILILGILVYHLFIKPKYVSKIRNVPGPSTRNLISGNLAEIFEGVHKEAPSPPLWGSNAYAASIHS